MDPVSLVLAALAAGALQGVGSAAGSAVTDAYEALRGRLSGLLSGRAAGEVALEQFQAAPEVWRGPLESELRATGVEHDPTLLDDARRVLALADPEGTRTGRYQVVVHGSYGTQIGPCTTQHNDFRFGTSDETK